MKRIKELLIVEIMDGAINWNKLAAKIHKALPLLEKKFEATNVEGKKVDAKIADALTFPVVDPKTGEKKCYKIFKPRFVNGRLYCHGFQQGIYDHLGKPLFILDPVMF
jgi:hypothetical protein